MAHPPAWVVLLVSCMLSVSAIAEDLPDSGESGVDKLHSYVADRVTLTASWLDSFFDNKNYQDERNDTSLRLIVRSFSEQGEGTDFSTRAKLRLRLPKLQRKALLFVSRSNEDLDSTDSNFEATDDASRGNNEDSLSLGMRYFFNDDIRKNASLSGGVRFRSGSPVAYLEPRYRYFRSLASVDVRFIQKLTWYTDTGLASQTQLQLERPVLENWFFRASSQLDWFDDEDGVFPKLGLEWQRPIDEQRAVAVRANSYFSTQPTGVMDSTVVGLRYRQQIWRKWLSFEVAPQVAFVRDDDYKATPGLFLQMQAEFRR